MIFNANGRWEYHEPMNVADLLQWQEIHPGTDTETWAWSPAGLGCIQNGLVCVTRY